MTDRGIGLAIVCPLTTTHRGYPFHVAVLGNPGVEGFVMAEQVKSIDYHARQAKSVGRASQDLLDEVLSILDASIY
jgi:mRNA interferase MazF